MLFSQKGKLLLHEEVKLCFLLRVFESLLRTCGKRGQPT